MTLSVTVFEILMLKLENGWIFPSHLCLRPLLGGTPLYVCRDEIWHKKTRIVGLQDGVEIMTLAFFVLTQYWRVTDGRTDTLLSQRPALAYSVARVKIVFAHNFVKSGSIYVQQYQVIIGAFCTHRRIHFTSENVQIYFICLGGFTPTAVVGSSS